MRLFATILAYLYAFHAYAARPIVTRDQETGSLTMVQIPEIDIKALENRIINELRNSTGRSVFTNFRVDWAPSSMQVIDASTYVVRVSAHHVESKAVIVKTATGYNVSIEA